MFLKVLFSSKSEAIGLPFSLKFGVFESAHFSSKSKAIGLPFSLKFGVFESAHFFAIGSPFSLRCL